MISVHFIECKIFCYFQMKVAVEGCCHGELNKIYETIAVIEQRDGIKVDLLLCCGDFQVNNS